MENESEDSENSPPQAIADHARTSFGESVRNYRRRNGWTQVELADRMKKLGGSASQTTIAKIERGDRPTPVSEAAVIAAALGIPVQALFATMDDQSLIEQSKLNDFIIMGAGDLPAVAKQSLLSMARFMKEQAEKEAGNGE